VQFIVVDAVTGKPIDAAEIDVVHVDVDFCREKEKKFTLRTDKNGIASRMCHDDMICGTQSGLRFTDTYSVYEPSWVFKVAAPGYKTTELHNLLDMLRESGQRAERVKVGTAKLVIPFSMRH